RAVLQEVAPPPPTHPAAITPGRRLGVSNSGGRVGLRTLVALQDDPQAVARLRPDAMGPRRLDRPLPVPRSDDVGRSQVIERQVAVVAFALAFEDTVAPRGEAARNRGERRYVLLVVPGVEILLRLGRGVHREKQHRVRALRGRRQVAGQRLLALEAA